MKYYVENPIEAALSAGGCTLEPDIGWWTYSPQSNNSLGKEFSGIRDALYIPTLQKNNLPVATEQVEELKSLALSLGFKNKTPASGMWVLSESGRVQIEYIWILWTEKIANEVARELPKLAKKIKRITNQDSVAYELQGEMLFV